MTQKEAATVQPKKNHSYTAHVHSSVSASLKRTSNEKKRNWITDFAFKEVSLNLLVSATCSASPYIERHLSQKD